LERTKSFFCLAAFVGTKKGKRMIFADASFIVSYFLDDALGAVARAWWRKTDEVLYASQWVIFEAENSMRSAHLKNSCTVEDCRWAVEMLKRAITEGLIEVREPAARQLLPEARRLSISHSETKSCGTMDLLHIAAAKVTGADWLVTFDSRQAEVARAEGLLVVP
jgi:predicted nucleic acid-binding protein